MAIVKHNMSRTRLYRIWNSMKQRCSNANAISYKNYGGKGIEVCKEWANDYQSFYDWAMSNGYADNLSIDRIDGKRNYEPSNCRWATPKEQQNNTSYNRNYTYGGETHNIMQWAEKMGISSNMLYKRLLRGWDFAIAITTKSQRKWGKI